MGIIHKIEHGNASVIRSEFGGLSGNMVKLLVSAVATMMVWYERSRQRRHLAQLDERMLRDIGLNRGDVEREIQKRPWQI
jgi:uncharacterized protein YjiS (DUF1127 family)